MRIRPIVAVLSLAVAAAACSTSEAPASTTALPPADTAAATPTSAPAAPAVRIVDGSFRPAGVETDGGTGVTLVNEDDRAYDVTFEGDTEFVVTIGPGESAEVDLSGESGVVRGTIIVGNLRAILTIDVRRPAAAPAAPGVTAAATYGFGRNHPAGHGLAGRMRVEQYLGDGERTVEVVADTRFEPGVGLECTVTVHIDGSEADVTGFLAVGDEFWVDTGSGWESDTGIDPRDLSEICGPDLAVFSAPAAASLLANGDPVEDTVGDRDALRLDLGDGIGERRVLGDLGGWVGLMEPGAQQGAVWIVDRRWIGRFDATITGAASGPLGESAQDYELQVTFSDLGTDVTVSAPGGGLAG